MSTAARKVRKRAGIRFVHPVKVATVAYMERRVPVYPGAWSLRWNLKPKGEAL